MVLYNLLLFIVTLAGGSIPLWIKGSNENRTEYLLAFSGSFLLSITMLHLLPETFEEVGSDAGLLVLGGFFIQLLIQRLTHGVEHGHTHIHVSGHGHAHGATHHEHEHTHSLPLISIIFGLSLHAFMEGLPLGFNYRMEATGSSLYLAVAAHKLPEAMLLASLVNNIQGRGRAWMVLTGFAMVTPLASMLANYFGTRYFMMSTLVIWVIPIVAGAFIHIATTIFFESGTRQHLLTRRKAAAMALGVMLGLATLMFE